MSAETAPNAEPQSYREQVEADRKKGLGSDTFWHRHGTPFMDVEQAKDLATNTPAFVKSMGQVLAGEYNSPVADTFQVMKPKEVAEVAAMVVKERLYLLESAIKDEEMSHDAAQAFVAAARLPMKEASEIMAKLADIPSGLARYERN